MLKVYELKAKLIWKRKGSAEEERDEELWVLASTMNSAIAKGESHLRRRKEIGWESGKKWVEVVIKVELTSSERLGTIDVR